VIPTAAPVVGRAGQQELSPIAPAQLPETPVPPAPPPPAAPPQPPLSTHPTTTIATQSTPVSPPSNPSQALPQPVVTSVAPTQPPSRRTVNIVCRPEFDFSSSAVCSGTIGGATFNFRCDGSDASYVSCSGGRGDSYLAVTCLPHEGFSSCSGTAGGLPVEFRCYSSNPDYVICS
jgi:hypothetical protein